MSRRIRSWPDALPFEAGDELAGNCEQVAEHVGEGLARRLLHRQHLDLLRADHQVIAVALDRRIGDEVVQVCVRRASGVAADSTAGS